MSSSQTNPVHRVRSLAVVIGALGLYLGSFLYEAQFEIAAFPRVHFAFNIGWGTIEFPDWVVFDAPPSFDVDFERTGTVRSHDLRRKIGWHTLIPKAVARVNGVRMVSGARIAPLWPFVVVIIAFRWRALRSFLATPTGFCHKCGYDLRGAAHEVCPECGEPPPQPSQAKPEEGVDSSAL
ncbi:MAG: hypothetical protein IT430_09170 [Phycisphaerales bacterium]|nr:hypothetical protein [Phycisphaerales bacterium]